MFVHVSQHFDPHPHATVAEARECEEAMYAEPPSCPVCDAVGCGGAYGHGCDQYERGDAQYMYEVQFEEMMVAA